MKTIAGRQMGFDFDLQNDAGRNPPIIDLASYVSICRALGGEHNLSPQEQHVSAQFRAHVSDSALQAVQEAIVVGSDPLGRAYCSLKSPLERRGQGQTFTPSAVVAGMFSRAEARNRGFQRIVDPGAGTGRFVLEGLRKMPQARAVAVEIDPVVAMALRANAKVLGFQDRLEVQVCDYRDARLEAVDGRTLFIGNPPYVRHHQIDRAWKTWYSSRLKRLGHASSQLAGLHLHFFLKTLELARPGDAGCFITAAEWLDVNYGRSLRELLTSGLGARAVYLLPAEIPVFDDALVTACITYFEPGTDGDIEYKKVERVTGDALQGGQLTSRKAAAAEPRWSPLFNPRVMARRHGFIELGTLFRVSRGQVTGNNRVWVTRDNPFGLPDRFLIPAITDATDIIRAADSRIDDVSTLRRVIDLPASLEGLPDPERRAIDLFLDWARAEGADTGYIARHRRPWWKVNLHAPPPIVMTYMGRRPPVFALNPAGARLINVAHGLYPREPIADATLEKLVAWLNCNVSRASGREYAGGLTKFEPSEVMRLHIPCLDLLESGDRAVS